MSVQDVREFWQKAQTDARLRQQLDDLKTTPRDKTVAAVVRVAAASGFTFTADEFAGFLKEELARQHAAGELSEAGLEQVAGGAPAEPIGQCIMGPRSLLCTA